MKRTKVQQECANPLFEQWLTEWREQAAIQRTDNLQHCFTKALSSLRKYPLPLARGKDCIILQYFGPKLCAMLDKRLDQHLKIDNINLPTIDLVDDSSSSIPKKSRKSKKLQASNASNASNETNESNESNESNEASNRKVNSERPFIPKSGSACHAFLITLYRKMKVPDYVGYMTKAQLQSEAQLYCDCSLKKSQGDSYYTGWSSMSTLTEKGLVQKLSSPAKYSLTDYGIVLAKELSDKELPETSDILSESFILSKEDAEPDLLVMKPRKHALSAFALNYCNSIEPATEGIPTSSKITANEEIEIIDLDNYELESRSSSLTLKTLNLGPPVQNFIKAPKGKEKENRKRNKTEKVKETHSNTESVQNLIEGPKRKEKENGKQEETEKVAEANSNPEPIFFLEPNSFDVILLVDTQETSGKAKQKDDATIAQLNHFNVQFEIRHLKVGDFAWIARCKRTNNELILPHIVERKRIDDLDKSIQDGRFHEQKFRLKQSGLKNLIYMVESYGKNLHTSIPLKSLLQASVNSLVQDGFIVKYTNSHKDSIKYLSTLTNLLRKVYSYKRLSSGKKEDLNSIDLYSDSEPLMEFKKFNKSSSKVKILKVREMLVRHLLQIKGISLEKALAIVELYPTPKLLFNALNNVEGSGEKLLAPLQYGMTKRQIGPASSKVIFQLYTQRMLN